MSSQRLSTALIVCLLGFPQISETIYTPSLPDIAESLAASSHMVEFTLSIYFIGFAFGVFLWGILADRLGRRPSMMMGIFLYILACIGCKFSFSIETLLAFRFVQAFGASAGSVVTMTMIRDKYQGTERNRLFSTVGAALAISPALGPILGGYIDQFFNWQANFILLTLIGLSLFIYSFFYLPETKPAVSTVKSTKWLHIIKRLCCDKRVIGFTFLIGACNGILFSYYAEAPFIFINLIGLTPGEYGLLGLVLGAASFSASYVSRHLASSLKGEVVILIGCTLTLVGSLALMLTNALIDFRYLSHLEAIFQLLFPLGVVFVGIGMTIPNCLSLVLADYQEDIGTAGSFTSLCYYILIAAFTCLMGVLHNGTTLPIAFYFSFLAISMGIVFYYCIYKEYIALQFSVEAAH